MQPFTNIFRRNLYFTFSIVVICIVAICYGNQVVMPVTQPHPFWLNVFFINYTFMGDAWFVLAFSLYCIFYKKQKKTGIQLCIGFLFAEMLVQLKKNIVYQGQWMLFFEEGQYLFINNESNLVNYHTFPSGHTALAFVLATVLIEHVKSRLIQTGIMLAALLLAFSRIYLAQHSITEVGAGMVIGMLSGIMAKEWLKALQHRRHRFYHFHTGKRKEKFYQHGNFNLEDFPAAG